MNSRFGRRAIEKAARISLQVTKRAVQQWRRLRGPCLDKRVLLVGGVQRSGTNMLMDVLDRSVDTDVYGEANPRAYHDFELRPRQVLRALIADSKACFVVFKALCDLHVLKSALDDFAPARALWIVRDYDDMVNSHLRKWAGCSATVGRIIQDRNSAGWRGRGMSDATHALLGKLYHPAMNDASAVALFWYFRNMLLFEQSLDMDSRVLCLRYEGLVEDPNKQFRRLFEFIELPYEPRFVRDVFPTSIRKDCPPDIEPSIREVCDSLTSRFDALFPDWNRRGPRHLATRQQATSDPLHRPDRRLPNK